MKFLYQSCETFYDTGSVYYENVSQDESSDIYLIPQIFIFLI